MPFSSDERKDRVLAYLIENKVVDVNDAGKLYSDAMKWYHRLYTIIDFNDLDAVDANIRRTLLFIIQENFMTQETFK